jgi:hypothetical protein
MDVTMKNKNPRGQDQQEGLSIPASNHAVVADQVQQAGNRFMHLSKKQPPGQVSRDSVGNQTLVQRATISVPAGEFFPGAIGRGTHTRSSSIYKP